MKFVAIMVLAVGLLLAGGAAYFAKDYYTHYQAMLASQVPAPPATVKVLAASKPLEYGDRLNLEVAAKSLQWVTWPKNAVPEGAFTSAEDLLGPDKKQTRTVLRTIEPGELVLKSKVTGFGEGIRVAMKVAEGMRAFTIPIDAVSGVAGLITPGDHVDILLTRNIQGELVTSAVLQNISVIATDQDSSADGERARVARTATVEVTPTDASKLALAQQVGKLSLSLRGVNEGVSQVITPVSIEDLPAQPEAVQPTPVKAPEAPTTIRVRKGAEVKDVPIEY